MCNLCMYIIESMNTCTCNLCVYYPGRYANRAKNIQNKPRINEDPKDALLREYQEEIKRLKETLDQKKGGTRGHRSKHKKKKGRGGEGSGHTDAGGVLWYSSCTAERVIWRHCMLWRGYMYWRGYNMFSRVLNGMHTSPA